jgi:hypothetical protein
MSNDTEVPTDFKVVPLFGNRIHPDEYIPEEEEYTPTLPNEDDLKELANGSRIRGFLVIALNDHGDFTNYSDGLTPTESLAGLSISQTLLTLRTYGIS